MNQTCSNILKSVINELKNGNFENISMAKIANDVNIGKSTIYEYYSSKEELIASALEMIMDDILNRILSISLEGNFEEVCKNHIYELFLLAKENNVFHSFMLKKNLSITFGERSFQIMDNVIKLLKERCNDIINLCDKKITARFLAKPYIYSAFLNGIIFNYIIGLCNVDIKEATDDVYDALMKMVND